MKTLNDRVLAIGPPFMPASFAETESANQTVFSREVFLLCLLRTCGLFSETFFFEEILAYHLSSSHFLKHLGSLDLAYVFV